MAKKLFLKIDNCKTCPYSNQIEYSNGGGYDYLCSLPWKNHGNKSKFIESFDEIPSSIDIPDWCELDDI